MKVTGYKNFKGMHNLEKNVEVILNNEAFVGIPSETDGRDKKTEEEESGKKELTNIEIAYIQSKGSLIMKIPERPFIEPGIENGKERLTILTNRAITAALKGNKNEALNLLERTAQRAVDEIKRWFYNPENGWPSLKPGTIRARRRKSKKATDPRPLIDTGQLRDSITYVIISKSGRKVGEKRR